MIVNDDRRERITRSFRTLGRVLAATAFMAFVASWFAWGPFAAIFYASGRLNSELLFVLSPFLLLLIPMAAICLPILTIRTIRRWSALDVRGRWWSVLAVIVCLAFPGSFARGLGRCVERRTNVQAMQNWLATLDPNDCEDQPLELRIAPGGDIRDVPTYVPAPPSVASLGDYHNQLSLDRDGRPMIRVFLGGGGLIGHWGIDVGCRDMPMPASDSRCLYYPLAPGAHIWSAD